MKRYTHSHEWMTLQGNVGTVGITHHAQKELGEIVFIELPKIGQMLQVGKEACILESTKAAIDIYSPASGKVIAVNEALRQVPASLHQTAETTGWLYRLELSNPREWDLLLSCEQKH